MIGRRFDARQTERLAQLLLTRLRDASLPAPTAGEAERSYTARGLQPVVSAAVEELAIEGLLHAGDGVAPVAPVSFLGKPFYPDITLAYHSQRLLACEVKFLRDRQRQGALATALGQASLYRAAGYEHALLVLLDVGRPPLRTEQVQAADELLRSSHALHLVVRAAGRNGFEPHDGARG